MTTNGVAAEHRNSFSHSSRGQSSKIKVLQVHVPQKALGKNLSQAFILASDVADNPWHCLAFPGSPWQSLALSGIPWQSPAYRSVAQSCPVIVWRSPGVWAWVCVSSLLHVTTLVMLISVISNFILNVCSNMSSS